MMPPHTHYVEPYFGGGAVLLAKDPEGVSEVVNDLNGDLVNFWKVLADEDEFARLQRRLQATPFSEPHWQEAHAMLGDLGRDAVSRACAFFVFCRQSMAGRMKHFTPITRTRVRRGMNSEASAWITAVDELPAVHARLRRVTILGPRPALEVIHQQDGPQTLFYLDPPYLHETRNSKGRDDYGDYEMSEADHDSLLTCLGQVEGGFLLSGYRSAMYDDAAAAFGWTRTDFDLPNNAAGGAEKRRMTECVWTNFGL